MSRAALLAMLLLGCSEVESDAALSARLLGTWMAPESRASSITRGESTWSGDGSVAGFVVAPARDGSGREVTFKLRATWKVERGVVHLGDFDTEPKGLFPHGHIQRYEIVSLTASEVVFRDLRSGHELYRRRQSL